MFSRVIKIFFMSISLLLSILFAMLIAVSASADETLRDPTRPLGHLGATFTATAKPLRLQSVLVSETRKLAYINGQQVREGDTIKDSGNTRVVRIDARGVVLQRGDNRSRLDVNSVVIRQ